MSSTYNLFLMLLFVLPWSEIHSSRKNLVLKEKNRIKKKKFKSLKRIVNEKSDAPSPFEYLPNELLLKIFKDGDKKIWLALRTCSTQFYNLINDKELKFSPLIVKNYVKNILKKYLTIVAVNEYIMSFHLNIEPTFEALFNYLDVNFKKTMKWFTKKEKKRIKKNNYDLISYNKEIHNYFFIVYCVRHYILHNAQLDYIKSKTNQYWDPGKKPQALICLDACIKFLKVKFTFPFEIKDNQDTYFVDILTTEKKGNYYVQMMHGKNAKIKTDFMCYSYLLPADGDRDSEIPFIDNYPVKSCSIIINKFNRDINTEKVYAQKEVGNIFKTVPTKNLKYLTMIIEKTNDHEKFNKKHTYNPDSPFYIYRTRYPCLKQVLLNNNDDDNLLFSVQPTFGTLTLKVSKK